MTGKLIILGKVTVELLAPFRQHAGNSKFIECSGDTIGSVFTFLTTTYSGLQSQLFDSEGRMRDFVNVFLNGEDIRNLDGASTKLGDGDRIMIMPAIAGG